MIPLNLIFPQYETLKSLSDSIEPPLHSASVLSKQLMLYSAHVTKLWCSLDVLGDSILA